MLIWSFLRRSIDSPQQVTADYSLHRTDIQLTVWWMDSLLGYRRAGVRIGEEKGREP